MVVSCYRDTLQRQNSGRKSDSEGDIMNFQGAICAGFK